jgi:LAO/AO transport system kinase
LAAPEAMRVLEAGGAQFVIVETVGVGQSEVEVARQADTTIVVLAPGMGDAVQAAKAGILEVADIFCVNKSDKEGTKNVARDLRGMLELGHGRDIDWTPPIIVTSATTDVGIDELWESIRSHEAHLRQGERLEKRRRERLAAEIREIVGERMKTALDEAAGDAFEKLTDDVLERRIDPYTAAAELLERFGLGSVSP